MPRRSRSLTALAGVLVAFGIGGALITRRLAGPITDPPTASLGGSRPQTLRPDDPITRFAVQFADGKWREYAASQSANGEWRLADDDLTAVIKRDQPDHWELQIQSRRVAIEHVWYPWALAANFEADAGPRDVLYYPYLMGTASTAAALPNKWQGLQYPGTLFAPLLVLANEHRARILAAINWPPKRVSVLFGRDGWTLRYDETIGVDTPVSIRILAADVTGDPARGEYPWLLALDRYKRWLTPAMRAADLQPIHHPDWLADIDGWLNVQLQNAPRFSGDKLRDLWGRWGGVFPWVQFWGQMSDYSGRTPRVLSLAPAPLGAGCCLPSAKIHERYQPELVSFVRTVTRSGHAGYYARPPDRGPLVADDGVLTDAGRALGEWLETNQSVYGANASYIDVIGHLYFGDPLSVAHFLKARAGSGIVIEYPVDVYPAAFLVSGSLTGGSVQGGPNRELGGAGGSIAQTTYPGFGRYLLDDRIVFLGESNNDYRFWGAEHSYWTERQAFLLGAKLDVMHPAERQDVMNTALRLIVDVRRAAGWWGRRPIYQDRAGITSTPTGIDIRRFRGRSGEDLAVIDNWERREGMHFRIDGRDVDIPADRLSILVLASASDDPAGVLSEHAARQACIRPSGHGGRLDRFDVHALVGALG